MAPWPILQRECVPIAHAPSTCCMCTNDIPPEDLHLIDCSNTCYRCLKNFCHTCSSSPFCQFQNSQIPVSSMYWNNHEEYEGSKLYIYCEPKCRALHHWHMAARRYTEAVQWRAYQHFVTDTQAIRSLSWQRQETHPGWNILWENFEALLEPQVIPPVPTSTPELPSIRGPAAVIAARIAAATVTSASHIVARNALSHTCPRRSDEDIAEEKYFNGLALAAANLE